MPSQNTPEYCPLNCKIVHNYDDELLNRIISDEIALQQNSISVVASENHPPSSVLKLCGTPLQNRYSEGRPGQRYYGGLKFIDEIELLCCQRVLDLFQIDSNDWDVNVQVNSGSAANLAVYCGLMNIGDTLLSLSLSNGGHLSHGHKVSKTSSFFNPVHYNLDPKTCLIDYNDIEKKAAEFKPKIIIAGASAYSREIDYKRIRQICDDNNALLLADISHIAGLVAGQALSNNPFDYAHVVTTTTHKTLRGPRSALIIARKANNIASKIRRAHFPGLSGGPNNSIIAAVAHSLFINNSENFKTYARNVIANAKLLSQQFIDHGFNVQSGGTDTHLFLVDVHPTRPLNISNPTLSSIETSQKQDIVVSTHLNGYFVEFICSHCNILINRNALMHDTNYLRPSGLRIGSSQITTRGFSHDDVISFGLMIIKIIYLTNELLLKCESKLQLDNNNKNTHETISISSDIEMKLLELFNSDDFYKIRHELQSGLTHLAQKYPLGY